MPHHRPRTIVITGASSGIGRATALAFAGPGQALVLTARRDEALETLATECRGRGATVRIEPADITDAEAVAEIARRVVSDFGWLDVWVNNAGVSSYGRTEELPAEMWRRVIDVNLLGAYYGIRAALPWMREQGSGVIVNVSSVLGKTPAPQQSAYVASKYALRALGESLRQELRDAGSIAVCTVLPGVIDTPLFRSAGNVSGHRVVPPGPPIDPRRVAAAIVRCAKRPKREVVVGAQGRFGLLGNWLAPSLTEKVAGRVISRSNFSEEPAARTDGNLFEPSPIAGIDDGWRRADAGRRPAGVAVAGAAVAAAVLAARAARNRSVRSRSA